MKHAESKGACLTHSLTLKMDSVHSSKSSVNSNQTTWSHTPEENTLYHHECQDFNSNTAYHVTECTVQLTHIKCTTQNIRMVLTFTIQE
jgi:hypothetical protein